MAINGNPVNLSVHLTIQIKFYLHRCKFHKLDEDCFRNGKRRQMTPIKGINIYFIIFP